jgi:GTP-binding protein Era
MKNKIVKIAIVGKTNAGKSTLINNIIGEKISIQNKKINTTQDLIIGIKNINKTQILFYDTPGSNFIKSLNIQSKNLKTNLWSGIDESDLILYLVDSKTINLNFLFDQLEKIMEVNKKVILAFNKIDLIDSKNLLPIIKKVNDKYKIESFFNISAKNNIGILGLLNYLSNFAYLSSWIYKEDEISNKDDKFIINELLRETLLTYLHKEIPYNLTLNTTDYKVLKNNHIKIKQKIIINEKRYKKIILGKKGEMIKAIREDCQKKISKILKAKVHLYLEIINS